MTVTEDYDADVAPDPLIKQPPLVKRTAQVVYRATDAVAQQVIEEHMEFMGTAVTELDNNTRHESYSQQEKMRGGRPLAVLFAAIAFIALIWAARQITKRL